MSVNCYNEKVRIGIYTPYLDTIAGGEKYMLGIASCLSKHHQVSIFWNPSQETTLKEQIKQRFDLDLSHISFVENLFSSHVSFFTRLKKTRAYDAIIVLSDGSIPIISSKLILHFQTPMPWMHPTVKTSLKLKKVSAIVCNSFYTKGYIDKEFGVKSEVIYPPVAIDKKNSKKENMILHVGRFGITNHGSSGKKQEFMAETFKKMIDSGVKDWKLVFVVSYKDDARKDIAEFKEHIQGYPIEFIENPSNSLLWETYNKAKIYWHASGYDEDLEKNPGLAEHFGISTVEAMGVGAVPIIINAGGQPEIVKHEKNGLLWNTQEELITLSTMVMQDDSFWNTLSSEAQKRAQDFSIERFCKAWTSIVL